MSEQAGYPDHPELVIVRGLPGVGKSTLARERFPGYMLWEPDALVTDGHGRYRFDLQYWPDALAWCYRMADHSLARGESCVVADVFPSWMDVEPYYHLAAAHRARMRVVTIRGGGDNPGLHRVPVSVLGEIARRFEIIGVPPSGAEFYTHEVVDAHS